MRQFSIGNIGPIKAQTSYGYFSLLLIGNIIYRPGVAGAVLQRDILVALVMGHFPSENVKILLKI